MTVDLSRAQWFTSSYSASNGQCVEVAHLGAGLVGVRDSKNLTGAALVFTSGQWDAFLTRTRGGTFDRA